MDPPWRRLPIDLLDVTVGPAGFVAVGVGPADWAGGDLAPLLYRWGSSDGVDWYELGDSLRLPLDGRATRLSLAGDRDRVMMSLAVDELEGSVDRTTLWTSTDGATWQHVEPDADAPSTHKERAAWTRLSQTHVTSLARTRYGWALSGGFYAACDGWVSGDGEAWERVPSPPQMVSRDRHVARTYCRLVGDELYAGLGEAHSIEEVGSDGVDEVDRPLGLWIGQLDD